MALAFHGGLFGMSECVVGKSFGTFELAGMVVLGVVLTRRVHLDTIVGKQLGRGVECIAQMECPNHFQTHLIDVYCLMRVDGWGRWVLANFDFAMCFHSKIFENFSTFLHFKVVSFVNVLCLAFD